MPDAIDALILDLLEWLRAEPRSYVDVMEAWRTSCPRLPVWEEANEHGYLERRAGPEGAEEVRLSSAGEAHLERHRPVVAVPR